MSIICVTTDLCASHCTSHCFSRLAVTDEHKFKDVSGVYFTFTADEGVESGKKKSSGPKLTVMKRLREVTVRSVLVCGRGT